MRCKACLSKSSSSPLGISGLRLTSSWGWLKSSMTRGDPNTTLSESKSWIRSSFRTNCPQMLRSLPQFSQEFWWTPESLSRRSLATIISYLTRLIKVNLSLRQSKSRMFLESSEVKPLSTSDWSISCRFQRGKWAVWWVAKACSQRNMSHISSSSLGTRGFHHTP